MNWELTFGIAGSLLGLFAIAHSVGVRVEQRKILAEYAELERAVEEDRRNLTRLSETVRLLASAQLRAVLGNNLGGLVAAFAEDADREAGDSGGADASAADAGEVDSPTELTETAETRKGARRWS